MNKPVLIIAEAGVNHNGDISLAKQLIEAAADARADYVKFQTFKSEKVVSVLAKTAKYQKQNLNSDSESQIEMIRKYELNSAAHDELIKHCKKQNIKFSSTAFDLESIDLLHSFNLDFWKIPSGEITNLPYLRKIGELNQKTILSTGMSSLGEIETALQILTNSGTSKEKITILHCNTQYPTPYTDVNLKAMQTIKNAFKVIVGYSDHTLGIEVPIAAVALGATVIEKHFTLDRSLPGPDHKASLEPHELKEMVRAIRNIELALSGNGKKEPSDSEKSNIAAARKSIHISDPIESGTILNTHHLAMKRPGTGISPMDIEKVLGKKTLRKLEEDSLLTWEDLEN